MRYKYFFKPHTLFFLCYFLLLFLYLLYINLHYLDGIPHVPDSVAYLFMAKIFASGHIILPIPANPDHFRFFDGTLIVSGGKWLFQYPFGHPLLLAVGVLLGFPEAIPPLIATATIAALVIIISKIYTRKTAFFLLPLPFISPFFIENSASFMSHTTASFYLTTAVLFLILAIEKKNLSHFFFSGVFIGLLFNTRPLTALPFLLFIAVCIFLKRKEIGKWYLSLLFYSAGFLLLFFLWMLYNVSTTGSLLVSQYFEVNKGIFGFGQSETLSLFLKHRIDNTIILTKNFFPMLYNLPLVVTLLLLTGFLLNHKKNFWDKAFFLSLFLLPLTYFFYNGTFLMYGSRFWYEIVPFTFLITARTGEFLYERFGKITILVFFLCIIFSLLRFYSVIPVTDPDFFSPLKLQELEGFNYVDNRIIHVLQRENIHHAVLFVEDCHGNWWCYGSVFAQNTPFLDTDIIYVRDLGEENQKIVNKYPDRKYYKINYDSQVLTEIH